MQVKSYTWQSWHAMRQRCADRTNPYYGGKGIKVCKRWATFKNFLADMGERPPGTTLDRRESDGNYTKKNCRWATKREQNLNHSGNRLETLNGVNKSITEWAEDLRIDRKQLFNFLRHNPFPIAVEKCQGKRS